MSLKTILKAIITDKSQKNNLHHCSRYSIWHSINSKQNTGCTGNKKSSMYRKLLY